MLVNFYYQVEKNLAHGLLLLLRTTWDAQVCKNKSTFKKANTYYDLLLNNETSRYVFRILAVKDIIENPKYYGFHFREKDLYQHVPTYSVSVDSAISNWTDFAHQHDINYKILKRYNPWLRKNYLTNNKRKVYEIEIPQKGYYTFQPAKPTKSSN